MYHLKVEEVQRENIKPVDKPKPEARTFPTLPKIKRTSSKPVAEVKPTVKRRTSIVSKVEQLHHKIFIMLSNMFIKAQTFN